MNAKEEPKQETIEEAAERILANDIDGLKELLNDDEMFYFYKGVIQCYGEAMAEWKQEQKQNLIDMMKDDEELGLYENWVEDAEKESSLSDLNSKANIFWSGYRVGVKSKERMYSEEDMRGMYDKSCGLIGLSLLNDQTENDSRFKKLFKQFKKK